MSYAKFPGRPEEAIAAAKAKIEALQEVAAKQRCLISIDAELVPAIIGRKGAMIQQLERETGCRINVDRSAGGEEGTATVRLQGCVVTPIYI